MASSVRARETTVKLGSYNLRYDSQPDPIPPHRSLETLPDPLEQPTFMRLQGEQPWSTRRIRAMQQIVGEGVDVIGFQEALVRQVRDLDTLLGDDWAWVGVGRDDGKERGEFSPIFYRKSLLTLRGWDTFWLSPTPFTPSKYPGAGSTRLCTVAQFTINSLDASTGLPSEKNITILNTHLDDRLDTQRQLGASMMLLRARYEAARSSGAVFVMGDYNSESTGPTSSAYHIQTGALPPSDEIPLEFFERFSLPGDPKPEPPAPPEDPETPKEPREPEEPPKDDPATSLSGSLYGLLHNLPSIPSIPTFQWPAFVTKPAEAKFKMLDLRGEVRTPSGELNREGVRGGFATYTGWGSGASRTDVWSRIDFVFGGAVEDSKGKMEKPWNALEYNTLNSLEDDGVLVSDHRLVTVTLAL